MSLLFLTAIAVGLAGMGSGALAFAHPRQSEDRLMAAAFAVICALAAVVFAGLGWVKS